MGIGLSFFTEAWEAGPRSMDIMGLAMSDGADLRVHPTGKAVLAVSVQSQGQGRINPMIVEGQVHRGLADGIGIALMRAISFDEIGNCPTGSFMDYLLPTSLECPSPELGATVTPSPL